LFAATRALEHISRFPFRSMYKHKRLIDLHHLEGFWRKRERKDTDDYPHSSSVFQRKRFIICHLLYALQIGKLQQQPIENNNWDALFRLLSLCSHKLYQSIC
jgi:hypothetical protein